MPTLPPPPSWIKQFNKVHETEYSYVVSNRDSLAPQPQGGNGLEIDVEEPFHLSLLKQPIWGADRFWYLGMLPEIPSLIKDPLFHLFGIDFKRLPIVQVSGGYQLKDNVARAWADNEQLLNVTRQILQGRFLPYCPLATCPPPSASSSDYFAIFQTEDAARRSAHRARRLILAMLCYVSSLIAASVNMGSGTPPLWFQALASAQPPFPPFWLDKIGLSPILTDFSGNLRRRGLYINVAGDWQIIDLLYIFTNANAPVWLCYPKGFKPKSNFQKYLAPTPKSIEELKQRSKQPQAGPSQAPPVEWNIIDLRGPDFDPNAYDQMLERKAEEKKKAEMVDIKTFFERRGKKNAQRDLSKYTQAELAKMRERGRVLVQTSKVYIWEDIEVEPWLVRSLVPKGDRLKVWEGFQPNQRVYDEFTDEWDLFDNIDPIDDVDCNIPGCRKEGHVHTAQLERNEYPVAPPHRQIAAHLRPITTYQDHVAASNGEWSVQSYTRRSMEPFINVARFRYGLQNLPKAPLRLDIAPQPFPISIEVKEILRAMVQEPAACESEMNDAVFVRRLAEFGVSVKFNEPVAPHISDCHMPKNDFLARYNTWGLTDLARITVRENEVYCISTVNTNTSGCTIGVYNKTSLKEIYRRQWGPSNEIIVRQLLERGIPFAMLWRSKHPTSTMTKLSRFLVPFRKHGYEFTPEDYKAYIGRRLTLFQDPAVARAALRHGGILWRLALESNVSLASMASFTVDDPVIMSQEINVQNLTLHHDVLSMDIVDTICGVYMIYTGELITAYTFR